MLHQEPEGKDKINDFAGKSLSKSKVIYPVNKLRFLPLKWTLLIGLKNIYVGLNFKGILLMAQSYIF